MKEDQSWLKNESLVYSVLSNNAYHVRFPHIQSTGFKMASSHYNERERHHSLAEIFLINSYLKREDPETELSISSYLTEEGMKMVSLIGCEDLSAYELIPLGDSAPLDIALGDSLVRRRSIRDYTGDPISLDSFATLVRVTAGVSAKTDVKLRAMNARFNLRMVPSGGGLYPIELYIGVLNLKKIPRGIYRYQPIDDVLIVEGDQEKLSMLLNCFSGAIDMVESTQASLIFLYVGKIWRSMRKYGNRGLRFMFQEVGAMTQNLHLAVAGLGLGSVDCASFFEEEAHQVLQLDGIYQSLLHTVLIGTKA